DRHINANGGGAGAARGWSIGERARPRGGAPDDLFTGTRALFHRAAALLRLFHAGPAIATACTRLAVHSGDQLYGPGGWRLVQESRNTNADLCWHQPAAVLPDRLLLAARSDPDASSPCGLRVPVRFRNRRTSPHRPARREPPRGRARLARAVDAGHC